MLVSMITGLFRWRVAPAVRAHPVIALVMAVLLLGTTAGGGTIAATSESLPDSPFYSVKLATEQVQLALAADAQAQESLRLAFEERRETERRTMEGRRVGTGDLPGNPSATGAAARSPGIEHSRVPSSTVTRTPEADDDCDDVTPVAGTNPPPQCTETPRPTRTPHPTETPDPDIDDDDCDDVTPVAGANPPPQCTETPRPSRTPHPTETPDIDDDDCDDVTPVAGANPPPQCTETPRPSRTPHPTDTPDDDDDDVPGPARTPRPEDDHETETPEPTHAPKPAVTPRPFVTPHPSRTPEHPGAATPTRKPQITPTAQKGH
jgi:hypothetical protein